MNEVMPSERFCSYCGETNDNYVSRIKGEDYNKYYSRTDECEPGSFLTTILGIIGIAFAFIFPLVTYCTSIPGWCMANSHPDQKGKTLNVVAVTLATIHIVFWIFIFFLNIFFILIS